MSGTEAPAGAAAPASYASAGPASGAQGQQPGNYGSGPGTNGSYGQGSGANGGWAGGSGQEPPAAGAGSAGGSPKKKPSRKAIIWSVVLVLVIGLGLSAYFFISSFIKGGAGSPDKAADKLVESLENEDVIGLFTMMAPEEREGLRRVQETLFEKADEFQLAEAAAKVSDEPATDPEDMDLSLAGVDISLKNVDPVVEPIDDNIALIRFPSGEFQLTVDPGSTEGALRAAYDASGSMEPINESVALEDLGPDQSGLTLVATESDGRWYISPLYTGFELLTQFSEVDRGSVPDGKTGADSPGAAATAAVKSLPEIFSSASLDPLAPHLSSHEGGILYYYGGLFDEVLPYLSGSDFAVDNVSFRDGEKDGDRSTAVVEEISLSSGYGDEIRITSTCLEDTSADEKLCVTGSGYALEDGRPTTAPAAFLSGGADEISLTTVKEDGKWKVSVMETASDWVVNWADSLTREQALALMDLAHSEEPQGDLVLGEEQDISFNSAGYAVRSFTQDEESALAALEEGSYGAVEVFTTDGKEQISSFRSTQTEVPAGDYKVVVYAPDEWEERHASEGNGLDYSTSFGIDAYVEPPTIGGSEGPYEGVLYQSQGIYADMNSYSLYLMVPEGHDVELVLTVQGTGTGWSKPGVLVVELDDERYEVPVSTTTEEVVIPYPSDTSSHSMELELEDGDQESTADRQADFTLEFVSK